MIYLKSNFFSFEFIKSEIYDRAKDYAKDQNKVKVYFEIGKILSEAGKEYGKKIIKQYSERLVLEVGKKYNERNLRYIRYFYEIFSSIKWNPVGSKLDRSHYREFLSVKDSNTIGIIICKEENQYIIRYCSNPNIIATTYIII